MNPFIYNSLLPHNEMQLNRSVLMYHLKSLLKFSILYSSYESEGRFLDFLLTFSTCHSLLKCCLWSWAVAKTAVSPQFVHLIAFSSFTFCYFFDFYGFISSSSSCSSFYFKPSKSSKALNCSLSRPLFYSFTMTPTNTSTTTLSNFLQAWLI